MVIGVLALQGAFAKHVAMVRLLGVEAIEVRTPAELALCDGLILPGGESTTMVCQMDFIGLRKPLCQFAQEKPLFGTCAGLILMAKEIEGQGAGVLGLLDLTVARNAYGSQLDSFSDFIDLHLPGQPEVLFKATFIRAPRIHSLSSSIQILATHKGEPILVQQGRHLAAAFHPELNSDPALHRYFLSQISK